MKRLLLGLALLVTGCTCTPYEAIFITKGSATVTHIETGREYEAYQWEMCGRSITMWTTDGKIVILQKPFIFERTR